jgi:hypothetical protein
VLSGSPSAKHSTSELEKPQPEIFGQSLAILLPFRESVDTNWAVRCEQQHKRRGMKMDITKVSQMDCVEFNDIEQTIRGYVYQVSCDTNSILVDFEESNLPKTWITMTNRFLIRVGSQRRNEVTGT